MRLIRTLLGLAIFGVIASAVAAAIAKGRMVSTGTEADDEFDLVTIYDGLEFTSHAQALRRGTALTWFAGGTIDLRDAALDRDGAQLELRTLFGGLQLIVPPSWRVEQEVASIFGGVGDVRGDQPAQTDGPVLRVSGWAAFGGVAIASEGPTDREPTFEPTIAPDEAEPAAAMA